MSSNKLKNLLMNNNINLKEFDEVIYNTLLVSIFEDICLKMKNPIIRQKILSRFHKTDDHVKLTEKIILKYTGSIVSKDESKIILKWLIAYFRKGDVRKSYNKDLKQGILLEQDNRCKICGRETSICDSELDHVIPWVLVGDELEDNLQVLCNTCNERKGKNIGFQLKMLLISYKNIENIS